MESRSRLSAALRLDTRVALSLVACHHYDIVAMWVLHLALSIHCIPPRHGATRAIAAAFDGIRHRLKRAPILTYQRLDVIPRESICPRRRAEWTVLRESGSTSHLLICWRNQHKLGNKRARHTLIGPRILRRVVGL